ncbi:RHS repeat-associated core domain-containing protein [Flavobacterium azooxidireducens]|uniref:RHS repeat-associated core domain-containing protein n=1 Tax=Flavobacterium azooxidireducens TaxID=1871076 RepID=A0ABY4KBX4_9FLAO|nr:RHS repeat-associated core domain-containing protein [Flavobacterium azooxidireducens]UPQ78290.1 RHS repeat-associated core domain-containing protein [Flavobacterium azooxidireducens]
MAEQHSQTSDYENRWKFTGHELDRETGLYYAGARYYDPKISIWLSVDPLAEKFPSWNPYNYVMQNPVSLIDPNGLYPIYFVTRSYAPFPTFGPGNKWHGDNRGHSLDLNASSRCSTLITYDTETRKTGAGGGMYRSYTTDGKKDAMSPTLVNNRTKAGSNYIDVHSAGTNKAQFGAQPIDVFTKLSVGIQGNIKKDHILSISGTISGDDFPNHESIIFDSEGNGLWLGNFETSGDREYGPVKNLFFEDEGDVNINVDIRIKVNKDGVFQGVIHKGKDGKDTVISIDDWNKKFKSDDNK